LTTTAPASPNVPEGFHPRSFGDGFIGVNGPLYVRRAGSQFQLGFRVERRHCNMMGICHGGMMATFCDMLMPISAHVLSADIGKRPQTVAQFREWLMQGPPRAEQQAVPPAGPAAAVWQFPSPSRSAAATPAREPTASEPAVPENHRPANAADDAATVQSIRRMLDAIPDPVVPLHKPARQPVSPRPAVAAVAPEPQIRAPRRPLRRAPRRRSAAWLIWVGIAMVVFAGLALNAWQSGQPPEREVAVVHPVAPETTSPPAQATPAPAPAPPIAAAPPPRAVEPEPVQPRASVPESPVPEVVVPPAPVARAPAPKSERRATAIPTTSPREQCGARTAFSLYRCMQQQCSQARWKGHPQCVC